MRFWCALLKNQATRDNLLIIMAILARSTIVIMSNTAPVADLRGTVDKSCSLLHLHIDGYPHAARAGLAGIPGLPAQERGGGSPSLEASPLGAEGSPQMSPRS